jgi:hypothetical protein
MSLKQPDWDRYKWDTVVEVWESVALAMDIDPEALNTAEKQGKGKAHATSGLAVLARYQDRLREAVEDLRMPEADQHYKISLYDFAWRMLLGPEWSLPEKFPRFKPVPWEVWRNKPTAELWKVVAVSVDISPDFLPENHKFSLKYAAQWGFPDKFLKRYEIADSSLNHGLRTVPPPPNHLAGDFWPTKVFMEDFAKLAQKIGWDLPKDFPTPSPDLTQTKGKWPWGDYETKLLGHLAAAVQEFWTKWDSTNPRTAPTNERVEEWLKGRGLKASRVREIIAQIIRSDDAPRGARPTP